MRSYGIIYTVSCDSRVHVVLFKCERIIDILGWEHWRTHHGNVAHVIWGRT